MPFLSSASWKSKVITFCTIASIGIGVVIALPVIMADNATKELVAALENRDWQTAYRAVQAGADVNLKIGGRPLLINAVRLGDLDQVRFLLDHMVDVNARTAFGRNALHEAALYGFVDIARLLIDRGIDVNARNEREETPLFYAENGLIAGPSRTQAHANVAALLRERGGVK